MKERRLEELLRETPIPGADDAERRGERVVRAAFEQRIPPARPALPRLAIALASATLLAALLLTSAGASVRDWIGDALPLGVRDAEPALTHIPGGGRLLVVSSQGTWVVQPDGSRRLLGGYRDATWSPRGLFVAAGSGHVLSAVAPDGTTRWSLSAPGPVREPRWSPSGFRIAYRSGDALRVVAGDGTGDALLDPRIAPVAPAWEPQGPHVIAYADGDDRLRLISTDSRERLASAPLPADIAALQWAPDGSQLLERRRTSLVLRPVAIAKLASDLSLGDPRPLPLPARATVADASFAPNGDAVAALLHLPGHEGRPPSSRLLLFDPAGSSARSLFTTPGRLSDLTWSPDGRYLLLAWRDADQWLFVPTRERTRVRAVAGIAEEFAPGATGPASFPRIAGWCCDS